VQFELTEPAKDILQAKIDYRPRFMPRVISATVGLGVGSVRGGDEVIWLGEWAWAVELEGWHWQASPRRR
jgi:hypothetical protein